MGTGTFRDAPATSGRKITQHFKGNFKSILCGVAEDFPMNMWDHFIPQADLTCNILHQSNMVPTVSVQAYVFGPNDFNWMPLALMGYKVQIHKKRVRGEHVVSTQLTGGTSRHLHTAIGALRSGVNTQEQNKVQTQFF